MEYYELDRVRRNDPSLPDVTLDSNEYSNAREIVFQLPEALRRNTHVNKIDADFGDTNQELDVAPLLDVIEYRNELEKVAWHNSDHLPGCNDRLLQAVTRKSSIHTLNLGTLLLSAETLTGEPNVCECFTLGETATCEKCSIGDTPPSIPGDVLLTSFAIRTANGQRFAVMADGHLCLA